MKSGWQPPWGKGQNLERKLFQLPGGKEIDLRRPEVSAGGKGELAVEASQKKAKTCGDRPGSLRKRTESVAGGRLSDLMLTSTLILRQEMIFRKEESSR